MGLVNSVLLPRWSVGSVSLPGSQGSIREEVCEKKASTQNSYFATRTHFREPVVGHLSGSVRKTQALKETNLSKDNLL